jgi:hypothetical protein
MSGKATPSRLVIQLCPDCWKCCKPPRQLSLPRGELPRSNQNRAGVGQPFLLRLHHFGWLDRRRKEASLLCCVSVKGELWLLWLVRMRFDHAAQVFMKHALSDRMHVARKGA